MKKLYVVLMDDAYIRDAEILHTEDMTDDEIKECMDKGDPDCSAWGDMEPTPFIGTIAAESEEEACRLIGKKYRYDPRVLYAAEIQSDTHLKNLLINLINDELEGRGETGEFVQDLCNMGFTGEDFNELGYNYFNDFVENN